jgi:photosystem I P700 chlorophyll a apoprotein A1
MHFHAAYFSNYHAWLKDPKHCLPSAHLVWSLVAQDILNSRVANYFQGIYITSGLFQLYRSEGIVTQTHLKYASAASLIGAIVSCAGSYFHMHTCPSPVGGYYASASPLYSRWKSFSVHHLSVLFGLGSMSWSGHQIHIALPLNRLLDSGVDPALMPSDDLLFKDLVEVILPLLGGLPHSTVYLAATGLPTHSLFTAKFLNPSTCAVFLGQIAAHHFYVALVFIIAALFALRYRYAPKMGTLDVEVSCKQSGAASERLSMSLAVTGSLSATFAHHLNAMPVYPYFASDYPTVLCSFCHHMYLAGFLIVGAGAHASIFMVRSYSCKPLSKNYCNLSILQQILNHRDSYIGHLIWVTIALGLHSFGLYIHNDTCSALGRAQDMFGDNSIQLKPVFACWVQAQGYVSFAVTLLDKKVVRMTLELVTADFMVHHIHAFTIHTTLLILLKGVLYARSSRLVSDKLELGYRYPCDGPGRGGTCQISPGDHIYLAVFWMYNSLSIVLFHYFFKIQSDVWGVYDVLGQKIMHVSGGDFSANSTTINAWLRNFLWSEAATVIQSYGSDLASFGLIFIGAHFVWAFSLMFLYSGRGYWQELIESILWAHHKLKIVPHIQPRALSISQGRIVGLAHYILGGIGSTWAFFISRMVALSAL